MSKTRNATAIKERTRARELLRAPQLHGVLSGLVLSLSLIAFTPLAQVASNRAQARLMLRERGGTAVGGEQHTSF